jgi:hypothetical protein
VISTLPAGAAPLDEAVDVDLSPPPPQAARRSAIAPPSNTNLRRCQFDFDRCVRRDAIDAPPETFVVVIRSSQPTTHHVERGPGS